MMIGRMVLSVFSIATLVLSCCGQTMAAEGVDAPTAQVKAVLDKAMEIQTRPELQGDEHRRERAKRVSQLIADSFLCGDMARQALGSHWDKLSAKQRSEFQDLFSKLFQDSYTRMVLNFLQKENIEYKAQSNEGKGVRVKTVIVRSGEHIPVNYDLSQKSSRWYIKDVEIDGVGILENYSSTFDRAIRTGSVEGLLQKLRIQSQAIQDES